MWAVWIALLLWAAPIQGVSTNCEIPAVEKLQNTGLTCKFSEDISKQKQDFEVHFYKINTTDSSEKILHCFWVDNKLECRVHSCCEYDRHVNETFTVRVLNVTDAHVGRYVCFVLPAAPDGNNFCNFTLREKITETSVDNIAVPAVQIVIPVIICIICIVCFVIVWRLKCRRKPEEKTTKRKTCQFWTGQWCSAKEKPVHEESKEPLNESKDEANDGSQSPNFNDMTDPMTIEKLGQNDDGTGATRETIQTLSGNELQIENETKEENTQKSYVYNYTIDIREEGTLAEHVIMKAMKSYILAKENSEFERQIAKEKAKKEKQNAREKAEKEGNLVKKNAKKDEKIAKAKAEKREKIVKEKAEKEERIADLKAKEEEKIAIDKTEKEEKIAKQTSKTTASIEEQVKKVSNEKEEHMKKIAKRKEEQMEVIAKEKQEQLEKIAKEKREELEKVAYMREKQLQEISKRKAEEIEEIRKKTKEEMERIANMREKQLKEISKMTKKKLDKTRKESEKQIEAKMQKKEKKNESIERKEERQTQKKGKGENQTTIKESDEVQGSDEQSKEKESEDDDCGVELANETEPFLTTKYSNVQVNPATMNQRTTDTVIIMSELASHQDTSEAPTRTHDQTSQAVDKFGTHFKKNNEDIESNGSTTSHSKCAVS